MSNNSHSWRHYHLHYWHGKFYTKKRINLLCPILDSMHEQTPAAQYCASEAAPNGAVS